MLPPFRPRPGLRIRRTALGEAATSLVAPSTAARAPNPALSNTNTDTDDGFGASVAISGDTIVVGSLGEDSSATDVNGNASNNDASFAGAAYVFVREGGTWTERAYLKASNAEPFDRFGESVAISEDTIVVCAPGEDGAEAGIDGDQTSNDTPGSGAAYLFERNAGTWTQTAYLKASNVEAIDRFGVGLAVAEDTIAVGADLEDSAATGVDGDPNDNSASGSGATYVFRSSKRPLGTNFGVANNNSTGVPGQIGASGLGTVVDNDVCLSVSSLPPGRPGIFFVGTQPLPGGINLGDGLRFVGGQLGRFNRPGEVFMTDADGEASLAIDLTFIPRSAGGPFAVMPGDTLHFQAWHRNSGSGGPSSNLTDALTITFQ